MPIVFDQKALFIHIPRTGGTNLERICGLPDDWPKVHLDKLFGLLKFKDKQFFALQHCTCEELLKYKFIETDVFDSLYKFAIVRDPLARLYSLYRFFGGDKVFNDAKYFITNPTRTKLFIRNKLFIEYKKKYKKYFIPQGFSTFVEILDLFELDQYEHNGIRTEQEDFDEHNMLHEFRAIKYFFMPQHKYIFNGKGELMVDHVCRFENYQKDMEYIFQKFGITHFQNIFNNSKYSLQESYKSHFDEYTMDFLIRIYGKDYELFDYSLPL